MEDPLHSPLLFCKPHQHSPLRACSFMIVLGLVERTAYFGVAANLVLYMTDVLHLNTTVAAQQVNNWTGAALMLPIVGAFISDSYLGKYRTVVYSSIFYAIGLLVLTLSASVSVLTPASCGSTDTSCPEATVAQLAVFYTALYLIAIGTGGAQPCLEAFGADQFDEADPDEKRMKSSFFNWWFFGLCMGVLLGLTLIVYTEDTVSWGLGYGILTTVLLVACIVFLAGTPLYANRTNTSGRSPFTSVAQVLTAAASKWYVEVPKDEALLYEEVYDPNSVEEELQSLLRHTKGLRCLDKAATIVQQQQLHGTVDPSWRWDPWKLCTVTQVEEVKLLARLMPIWVSTVVFGVVTAQTLTFFVEEAATMDRELGATGIRMPSGSLLSFGTTAVLVSLPIYEWGLVPITRRWTGRERGMTVLQRIGIGLGLSVVCMVVAAMVERKRLEVVEKYGLEDEPTATVPMSVLWLVPQYILHGICDAFVLVGEQELFYGQIGDGMRSVGVALYLCSNGLGRYVGSALISVVQAATGDGWIVSTNINRSRLDYYYYLLAVLAALNLLVFVALASSFTYKTKRKAVDPPLSSLQ